MIKRVMQVFVSFEAKTVFELSKKTQIDMLIAKS